jgi:hypothetical protein
MKSQRVAGHDSLYRDITTRAIINTDKSLFDEIKKSRNGSSVIKGLQSDVEILKHELSEIKDLLRELISNGNQKRS